MIAAFDAESKIVSDDGLRQWVQKYQPDPAEPTSSRRRSWRRSSAGSELRVSLFAFRFRSVCVRAESEQR